MNNKIVLVPGPCHSCHVSTTARVRLPDDCLYCKWCAPLMIERLTVVGSPEREEVTDAIRPYMQATGDPGHPADKWIAEQWQGKTVRQIKTVADCAPMPGTSTVSETMWDEKGALHCHMANGYWVPAALLAMGGG